MVYIASKKGYLDLERKEIIIPAKRDKHVFKYKNIQIIFPPDNPQSLKVYFWELDNTSVPNSILVFKLEVQEKGFIQSRLPYVEPTQNNGLRLYLLIYDEHSGCWIATTDTKSPTLLIPTSGTYAIVYKEYISSELQLYRDLLAYDYKTVNENEIKISVKVPPHVLDQAHNYETAYHGTNIGAIESIITEGLLLPGTLTGIGKEIFPPPTRCQRNREVFGIKDFACGIFVTPSIHYASLKIYAAGFRNENVPSRVILECLVEKNKFRKFENTTQYDPREGENLQEIEWRIEDPNAVHVKSIIIRKAHAVYK